MKREPSPKSDLGQIGFLFRSAALLCAPPSPPRACPFPSFPVQRAEIRLIPNEANFAVALIFISNLAPRKESVTAHACTTWNSNLEVRLKRGVMRYCPNSKAIERLRQVPQSLTRRISEVKLFILDMQSGWDQSKLPGQSFPVLLSCRRRPRRLVSFPAAIINSLVKDEARRGRGAAAAQCDYGVCGYHNGRTERFLTCQLPTCRNTN